MPAPLRSVIPVTDQPNLVQSSSDVPPAQIITQNTIKKPPTTFFEPPFLPGPIESQQIEIISTTTTQKPTQPSTPKPVPVVTNPPTTTPEPTTTTREASTTTQRTNPPTNPPTTVAVTPRPTAPLLTKIPVPFNSLLRNPSTPNAGKSADSCCCDDDSAKLILPISMKHLVQDEGSCGAYAKLIIPVEGLNPDSLRSLTRSGDATHELLKSVLQSLS